MIEETTKKSHNGSKILPNSDFSFKILATNPSSQSLIIAIITNNKENIIKLFFKDKKIGIDNNPLKIDIVFETEKNVYFFLIK